jgi:HAD superfamily hydrolase (TIGR01509 family)
MSQVKLASPAALIFHMDGVLIDSEPLHKRAKEEAFGQFGIVLPESVYDSYKGRPDATMLPEVLGGRGCSAEMVEEISRLKRQIYEGIQHELSAVPGASEFVKWAATRYRIALATSATSRNRELALKIVEVGHLFEAMVDSSQHKHPKPNPEVFQVAMRRLGLTSEDCWIIEDSVNGLRAAKAAGCVAAAITTTFDAGTLAAAGADLVVESFDELRKVLERV